MLAAQLRAIGRHQPDAHRHRPAAIGAGAGQHVAVEPKIGLAYAFGLAGVEPICERVELMVI